ncbi:MAG: 4-oxalomesaconate tautomerase [Bauldia sp.]
MTAPVSEYVTPRLRRVDEPSTSLGIVALPCTMMRGGTSRGAFFSAADLPRDVGLRDRVLLAAMGSPHPLQVDGIGGGNSLTSKVAIVGPPSDPRADVDYLFAQVSVDQAMVDTKAACGNILAAVGPFAIEAGLVATGSPFTVVHIHNLNSGTITVATLSTPWGRLRYDGDQTIAGCAASAAPVRLSFVDAAGAMTGRLLPSGRVVEAIDGIPVSLVDYAIPVMIVEASRFGLSGRETPAEIDANRSLLDTIEQVRRVAGRRMGLGDVSRSVTPKVALVSPPRNGGTIASRYLTPWHCHLSHAVTGALCLTAASRLAGSVAAAVAVPTAVGSNVEVEHPAGALRVDFDGSGEELVTSVVRTARLLFKGHVYVPEDVFQLDAPNEADGARKSSPADAFSASTIAG